jgi:peptidoglycan LD-endopeptidase LytH
MGAAARTTLRAVPSRVVPMRRKHRASGFSLFGSGFLLGALSLYVALAWTGGLMPPALSRPSALAPATPAPLRAASPVPGDSTDVPDHPFDPPPDLTRPSPAPLLTDFTGLQSRALAFPVVGFDLRRLRDDFAEKRGTRVHEAIDIVAPRGAPVVAVDDGRIAKLFKSARGGLTVYQFDPTEQYCYYYAHLERYAEELAEGQTIRKGQRIGDVGTSGNAPPDTPHLHFTIFKLGPDKRWWEGTPVNPFPLWALAR